MRNEITADRYEHNFVHGRLDIEHGSTAAERFTIEGKLNRLPHDVGYYIELKAAHPISKVDVTLTSDVTSTNENAAGGIHLTYLTAGGQYKNLKLRNQLHKFENKLQTMASDICV